jgi:hypothetical protein
MSFETIKLCLTIWGAGLSTLLGIIAIFKFRNETQIRTSVFGIVDQPFDHIRIVACNKGTRPVTLTGYSIGIGEAKSTQNLILKKSLEIEKKLSESDMWTITIDKTEIQSEYKKAGVKQIYFQLLWVNVFLSSGKVISNSAYVSPGIISKGYFSKAEQFIAADIFLGLPQMESKVYPIHIMK